MNLSASTLSGGKSGHTCLPDAPFLQVVSEVTDMKNTIEVRGSHAEIICTDRQGRENGRVLISIEDIDKVSQYRCFISHKGSYAQVYLGDRKRNMIHRFLLDNPGEHIDHVNGDGLDNRRENIRTATQSQNMMNRIALRGDMRGIDKAGNKWQVGIKANKHEYYLGLYETVAEAMAARQAGERILFGEYNRKQYDDCA